MKRALAFHGSVLVAGLWVGTYEVDVTAIENFQVTATAVKEPSFGDGAGPDCGSRTVG